MNQWVKHFVLMSCKILLKTGGVKWRERFMPFNYPQAQHTLDGKWKLIYTAPKLLRDGGGRAVKRLLQSQGKRCPCPSSGSQVVLSLQYHLSPETPRKPWAVVFLHCTVSVIRVLIHVNLCENYCVQQYFLVYCFLPTWIVPFCFLFFSFLPLFSFFFLLVICLSSFKRKNKNKLMCCRPICNLFLSLIL